MKDKKTKELIKNIYGKPDMKVRYQLYGLMKNNPDYKAQLIKMKKLLESYR
jgi:hypothetical protein